MTDYIRCNDALEIIKRTCGDYAVAFAEIRKLPAANVVDVVHGKWENGNPICPVCDEDKFKDLDADIWCDWQPDFCPNCG